MLKNNEYVSGRFRLVTLKPLFFYNIVFSKLPRCVFPSTSRDFSVFEFLFSIIVTFDLDANVFLLEKFNFSI